MENSIENNIENDMENNMENDMKNSIENNIENDMKNSIENNIKNSIENINKDIEDAQYVLIGIGSGLIKKNATKEQNEQYTAILNAMAKKFEKNNYFILYSGTSDVVRNSSLNEKRISCPMIENENEEKQWDFYNKWISSSLSKKIVIIEIAEGFNNPNIIRWPFEKITMINDKARMYRVNSTFYQVPKEIAEKAAAIKTDEMDFLKELVGGC